MSHLYPEQISIVYAVRETGYTGNTYKTIEVNRLRFYYETTKVKGRVDWKGIRRYS